MTFRRTLFCFFVVTACFGCNAQTQGHPAPAPYRNPWAGDSPTAPGPMATDLSPALKRKEVTKIIRRVGDWELAASGAHFSPDWTQAVLYRGYLAAADALPEPRYREAMLSVAREFKFELGPRKTEADDQAIGYAYLKLYEQYHEPAMLAATKADLDDVIDIPNVCVETCPPGHDEHTPVWWWADSFFMAAPVWAEMYHITGDRRYLDHMDKDWWTTSDLLYDKNAHLFTRDASYLAKHEANGKKVFWSRGNGWVLAALAMVLEDMPADYPSRPRYVAQFREMAASLLALQGRDGLWRPGLLNAAAYPLPEVSGSAFFIYGYAWGLNHHVLDRATYLPAVRKGWAGLDSHIYANGRLGSIQPIGSSPDDYKESSSYVFGVGAFLMAGAELERLAKH